MGELGKLGAALAAAGLMVGCGTHATEALGPSAPLEVTAQRMESGEVGQTMGWPNGVRLNGTTVAVRYEKARLPGTAVDLSTVWLEGAELRGQLGLDELSGSDFQNMRFVGDMADGSVVALRIDSVVPGSGTEQDVWSYGVSYQNPTDMRWYPLCTSADGSPVNALALENRWNYREGVSEGGAKIYDSTAFTFACEGAALAKCVHYGYKPWQSVNGLSLEDYHQTCTRMVRADFCGNGTAYTHDGNWVNLYDALNVQTDTEAWVPEAEWTPRGATCFTLQTRATAPIQCADGRVVTSCATSFSPGTLLISETPPQK